jgi:nitrate reductase gamma subunit
MLALQPDAEAMQEAPLAFQLHTLIGMLLFAIWPFTRLVHAFSAPIGYLFTPMSCTAAEMPPGHDAPAAAGNTGT